MVKREESLDIECIGEFRLHVKNKTPETRWKELREYVLKKGSPIYRYRFEAFWPKNIRLFDADSLSKRQQFFITIRAIGPRAKCVLGSDEALLDALTRRDILPDVIQRQSLDSEWPNTWVILINMEDCVKLPSYQNKYKGLFWNPDDQLYLFVWNVVPNNPEERLLMEGRNLIFEAFKPMLYTPKADILDDMTQNFSLKSRDKKTAYPLDVKSAEFGVVPNTDPVILNGNYNIVVGQLPTHPEFKQFIRHPTGSVLPAWYHDLEYSCKLLPACRLCGTDGHKEATCPYKSTIPTLMATINTIRNSIEEEDIAETVATHKRKRNSSKPHPTRRNPAPSRSRHPQTTHNGHRNPKNASAGPTSRSYKPKHTPSASNRFPHSQAGPSSAPKKIRPSSVPPLLPDESEVE